jgi:hypothetical protein
MCRIVAAIPPEHTRANRICWYGWAASAGLGLLAPLLKHLTHGRLHGSVAVFCSVAVMVGFSIPLRRDHRGILLPLLMSASALALGGAAGFLLAPQLGGKSHAYLLGPKWAVAGTILTYLYLRLLRLPPPTEPEDLFNEEFCRRFEAMSDEEKDVEVERIRTELHAGLEELERLSHKQRKVMILGGVFCALGIGLLALSYFTRA